MIRLYFLNHVISPVGLRELGTEICALLLLLLFGWSNLEE